MKSDRIEIRVTPEFKRKLKKKCADLNIPMSAYLLAQLVEPDWVSKIKIREGRPPSKSIWRPGKAPRSVIQKRIEDGVISTLDKTNMIHELKKVIFNGVDEFFEPYVHKEPEDIIDRGKNILIDAHNRRVEKEKKRLLKEASLKTNIKELHKPP